MVVAITVVKPIFWVGSFGAGLWNAGSRRCKIFHADFLCYHVAIPGQPLRPFSAPVSTLGRWQCVGMFADWQFVL